MCKEDARGGGLGVGCPLYLCCVRMEEAERSRRDEVEVHLGLLEWRERTLFELHYKTF